MGQTEGSDPSVSCEESRVQGLLIAAGIAMVCFGALRGEAGAVLNKAIRLCLECVGIG